MTSRPPVHMFQDVAPDPTMWWIMAQDLFHAAEALLDAWRAAKPDYSGGLPGVNGWDELPPEQQQAALRIRFPMVFLFLVGLALENLLKGLLLARDPGLAAGGRLAREIGDSHRLSTLFQRASIPLSTEQVKLVDRLSESILWAGRYPVPKTEDKFQLPRLPSGAYYLPGTFFDDDEVRAHEIWDLVATVIDTDPTIRRSPGAPGLP
jgi:hypothetical protein